jgi:putative ATPase
LNSIPRCYPARVYLLKSLTSDDIEQVLDQAMNDKTRGYGGQDIVLPDETRKAIADLVNGDARRALNTLEMMADMAERCLRQAGAESGTADRNRR